MKIVLETGNITQKEIKTSIYVFFITMFECLKPISLVASRKLKTKRFIYKINQISSLQNDRKRLIYVKTLHPLTNKGIILRDQRLTPRGENTLYYCGHKLR